MLEEDRHWWFATRTKSLLTILDRFAPPHRPGRRVLDVGCGAGNMFHHLARYGEVEGIDNNPKPLVIARERGYSVQLGVGEQMPYEDNRFDLVAALDVVEHVEDDLGLLKECYRVCKPGGYIVSTVPAFQWLWSHNDEINGHQRRYTRPEFRERLQEAGFTPRRLTYNYFAIFPMSAAMIVLRRGAEKEPELATPDTDDEAYQVEMEPASPLVNTVLGAVGSLEAWALRAINMPVGTSITAVAQK
jgi:ubiquinone/menaquinone biosynthesis C-methylase UbiE